MTELQEAEQRTPVATRPRRRRRVAAVLVAGGLVATTVTAGLVTGVVGPAPLQDGGTSAVRVLEAPPADPGGDAQVLVDAVTEVTNTYGSEHLVHVEDGRWLDITASVYNDSSVPVRVTGVSTPFGTDGPLDVLDDVQVTVPVSELGDSIAWRPLGDGVVVPPHVTWRIRVVGRLDTACDDGPYVMTDGQVGTDQIIDVDYEVLGIARSAAPTMAWTVSLVGPFNLGC